MPDVPPPESTPSIEEWYQIRAGEVDPRFVRYWRRHPLEVRFLELPPQLSTMSGVRRPRQRVWMRALGGHSSSPLFDACVLTYGSDLFVLGTVLLPHGVPGNNARTFVTSLDHTLWFHTPTDMTRWHLFDLTAVVADGGRGLATGAIFAQSGECVATVAQEGLIRALARGNGRSAFEIFD
jgi:acyl-CoA thioesterase-2